MDANLLKAILAMDSYNQGYDQGIKMLPGIGSKIGTATITTDSLQTAINSGGIGVGFYAVAYKVSATETVISYRGTDSFTGIGVTGGNDFFNGYGPGIGIPGGPQASQAIDFYKAVAGTTGAALKNANISLTGHSLGAGLGGYVAAIYGKSATIFDNMPFEMAAENAADGIPYGPIGGMAGSLYTSDEMRTQIYGSTTTWQNNLSGIKMYYVPVDSFYQNYLSTYRALNPIPQAINTTELTLAPDVPLEWTTNNKVGQGHDMTLIVMNMFGKTNEALPNTAYWKASEPFWIPALFKQSVGLASGGNNTAFAGTYLAANNYAEIMRNAIAYSAIDGKEAGAVTVFGDTGIRAMFNDATDLGKALDVTNVSTTLKNSAQSISDVFVQFAGQLALGKVLQSSVPATVLNGAVTLSPDNTTLSIDFSSALWANGKTASGAPGQIVGRDELIDSVFSQANTTDIRTGMNWLWNDTTTNIIDKATFATSNASVTATIPNRTAASDRVGIMAAGGGGDNITGSNDRDFIYGGGGNDTLNGGVGDDLLAGGANDDVLIDPNGKNFFAGGEGIDKTSIATLTASGLNVYSPAYVAGQTNSLQLDAGGGNINEIVGVEKVELTPGGDKVFFSSAINTQATQVLFDGMGHAAAGDRDGTAGDVLNFKNYAAPVYLTNVLPMNTTAIPGQTSVPYAVDMYANYAPIHNLGYTNPNGLHFTNFQNVIGSNFDDRLNLTHLSPAGDLTAAQRTQLQNAQSKGITLGDPVAVAAQIDANMNLARQLPQNQKVALIQSGDGNDMVVGTETAENYIYGGKGNDYLRGGGFTSVVNGEAGEDTVEGGGFKSQLYGGGSEKDFFILSNGAFAMDAGTEDYASWGSMPLSGGVSQWWNEGGFAYWTPFTSILASTPFGLSDFTSLALMRLDVMPMTTVRYAMGDSGQLAVQFARGRGGQAVINNYDLDLNTGAATGHVTVFQQVMEHSTIAQYTQYINLALQAAFGTCIMGTDPLIIDLNKNGLELTDAGRGVYFDFDNNGFAERTAWVKAGDAAAAMH